MTNRVPPIHPASPPPLHPASPPPFIKYSSYDDDVDENNDFSDYTIPTIDHVEKCHQDSETVEIVATERAETSCVNYATTFDSNNESNLSEKVEDIGHEKLTADMVETLLMTESNIINVGESSANVNDDASKNSDYALHLSASDSIGKDASFTMCSQESNLNALTSQNIDDECPIVLDDQFQLSVSLDEARTNNSTAESSDESSCPINEDAFVVVANKSEKGEEGLFTDSSRESPDYETNIVENVHSNVDASFSSERTFNVCMETPGSCADTKSLSLDAVSFGFPSVSQSFEGAESTLILNKSLDSFHENDEFDDFVSPVYESPSVEQLPHDDESNLVDDDVLNTSSAAVQSVNIIDATCWNDIFKYNGGEPIEVNLNTLEGKLNGSSIWCKIKSIEASPALNYNWNDSEIKKILLTTLCVDSRNILFGPRWNSEVPRFASNLGLSPLVPQKASTSDTNDLQNSCSALEEPLTDCNSEKSSQNSTGIRDALFDWTGSGLTNPLDTRVGKCDKNSKSPSTVNQLDYDSRTVSDGSSVNRGLSAEAIEILNSLPDLLVMEKQYIVFPIR